ncbi:MAG: hypothetical protein AB9869_12240 [Verrucomicrobiia bacterium]
MHSSFAFRHFIFTHQLVLLAAGLLFASGTSIVMAQAASGFAVNPLQTAPAARYTSDPLSQRTQLESDPDPRVHHLGTWLRGTMARLTERERGQPPRPADLALVNRQQAVAKLREATGGDLQIQFRPQNGTAMFIKGSLQRRATGAAKAGLGGDLDEQTARAFLRANRDLFQIEDPDQEFRRSTSPGTS